MELRFGCLKGYSAGVLAADVVVIFIRQVPTLHPTPLSAVFPLVIAAVALFMTIAVGALIPFIVAIGFAYVVRLSHWSYFAVCGAVTGGLLGAIGRLILPGSALSDPPDAVGLKNYLESLWTIGPDISLAGLVAALVYWYIDGRRLMKFKAIQHGQHG